MSLSSMLEAWRKTPTIAENITAWKTFPARPAQTAPFPAELHPTLLNALRDQGILSLYTHQAEAWDQVRAGRHVTVVTGTASGKTLCYNLPVLHHILDDPQARALYLFPTKALAHDQAGLLRRLIAKLREQAATDESALLSDRLEAVGAAPYDGDTPVGIRPTIRGEARIILSNPDMLHTAILPHHTKWADFFQHLRFVVIDEMHSYRGVFGSHVANLLRRLKRVTRFYGSAPQFILTSATIANPAELAERLIEAPVAIVEKDGAARGPKHFVIYNPPVVDVELGLRRSVLQESIRLTQELLQQNVQTIVFGRARRTIELLLRYLREAGPDTISYAGSKSATATDQPPGAKSDGEVGPASLVSQGKDLESTRTAAAPRNLQASQRPGDVPVVTDNDQAIRAYRSGYLPHQRREIERGLRDGRVRAVVATSALELGIDIGGMGAAVLAGYPGTIAATWQQAGRAGRQAEAALAMLVTSANPLDQFLARHPAYFFDRPPEQALINPNNLLILLQHLRCAAFELPFQQGDSFGKVEAELLAEFLQVLQEAGQLHQSGSKYFWMADQYPAEKVSLRSASPATVQLLSGDDEAGLTTIGAVDIASAPWMVHPQAVYLHEGQSFIVEALDLDQLTASLRPARVDYYTEPRRETTVQLVEERNSASARGGMKHYGEILVMTQVIGYRMVQWYTHERLGDGDVDLPPSQLHTTGYWLALASQTVAKLRDQGLWTNDPNDYGPNWSAQRSRARARDAYRCQMCGLAEQDREHDVHHKIPFRRFQSYQQANQLSNLITLCRPCHRRAETAVRMRSGLAGLATALGHLAPLFLMCDRHDVGLHADPQSPLAQGQPAVIIYDMVPAGVGFSERLFDLHDTLIERTRELVAGCACRDGCPSCVGPAGEDGAGGKRETMAILQALGEGDEEREVKREERGAEKTRDGSDEREKLTKS